MLWDNSFDMNVKSREEFIRLITLMNEDIQLKNITRKDDEKQELLDLKYLLRRYGAISSRDAIKLFREIHDCKNCLYYEKPRRCQATKSCPLQKGEIPDWLPEKYRCPKDSEGNCPYGNEVGTCFRFCWNEILADNKTAKEKSGDRRETGCNEK